MRLIMSLVLLSAVACVAEAGEVELPKTLAWTAYNLGTTGYNQAVAIGKVLKDEYNVTLRVVPGKNDISRLVPLVKGRVQFSANGMATYFAQEGVFQFEHENWGPLKVRLVLSSNGDSNQSLAVAADTGITHPSELKGRRVPYVRGAPALNVAVEAFLACGNLGWEDVKRVDFPGYNSMWNGIVNGHVDAAFANTVSGPARKLEASPRGIKWLEIPHDDKGCIERLLKIAPYFTLHVATRGAGITAERPNVGVTYPYPLLIGLDSTDETLVYSMIQVIHKHYDAFKNADPGAIGWAMDRQPLSYVVPYHAGAVRYLKEIGVWSEANESNNQRLLERQRVLSDAWTRHKQNEFSSGDVFQLTWRSSRVAALEAAGFDPVWR
ncbi:MAG: TAXI family TRAP transporter solute-binding subunit [Gammaproteobacteria bacterium]|nr:TAXI family TRAP transporter solute-binding subunit [Gammaproteobacteria bacterium]MCZ6855848.1 TAXI family TRAP transporter solute-binding subunit [Gammaproteobacteria bacterium]